MSAYLFLVFPHLFLRFPPTENTQHHEKVAGGAELVSLVGVGGWNAEETEQIRRRVNDMALSTLNEAVDGLEAVAEAFETGQH